MAEWDPGKFKIVFGAIPISGFAPGTMVSVNPLGEGDRAEVGTAGETAIVRSYDKRADVIIRLMATANSNKRLSAWYQAGNLPALLMITSLSTGEVHASGEAVLKRTPGGDYGAETPVREWTIVVPLLETIG